jgi:LacI family transcriptional regulator, galactose operon repressor
MLSRQPTQRDVARRAGVSQATVSLVLSGAAPAISAETLERVSKAARELGYVPNRAAQALRTSRTMMVACIVPDITNPFYPALVRGIQSVAEALKYDVLTVNTDGSPERERHFLEWFRQGRVDGVIGAFFTLAARDFKPLVDAGVAVVRIESSRKHGGDIAVDDIYVDSRAAAYCATSYLIKRGHERIAMVAGRGGPQAVRVEGYCDALAEAGVEPHIVIDDAFSEVGGSRAAEAILASDKRPSAIFAANDLMAIGVMKALVERGVAIPDDIAVVGFDDIPVARLVTPQLTTVAQFQDRIGARAAEILLARLEGRAPPTGTAEEMPFSLVERASA